MRVEYEDFWGKVRYRNFKDWQSMWQFVRLRLAIKYGWAAVDDVFLLGNQESRAVKRRKRK